MSREYSIWIVFDHFCFSSLCLCLQKGRPLSSVIVVSETNCPWTMPVLTFSTMSEWWPVITPFTSHTLHVQHDSFTPSGTISSTMDCISWSQNWSLISKGDVSVFLSLLKCLKYPTTSLLLNICSGCLYCVDNILLIRPFYICTLFRVKTLLFKAPYDLLPL